MDLSDRVLVEKIKAGSREHFDELYSRYFQRVYNFVYRRISNHPDTEELVQEIFYSIFEALGSFRGKSSLLSWIFGVTRNKVNNFIRRSKRMPIPMDDLVDDSGSLEAGSAYAPDDSYEMKAMVGKIYETLDSLNTLQYEVFMLRHVEDLPIDEIARRIRKSQNAVKSNLYRVKKRLSLTAASV